MKKVLLAVSALVVALGLYVSTRTKTENPASESQGVVAQEAGKASPAVSIPETKKETVVVTGVPQTFQQYTAKTWTQLPKLEELQKLSREELHHTPKPIQRAALALGELAQTIHDNPEHRKEGFEFYEKCAAEAKFPMSVRASCLKSYRKLGAELGERLDESQLPQHLRVLTSKLEN